MSGGQSAPNRRNGYTDPALNDIRPLAHDVPGVAVVDAEGRVLSWNATAERLTGWPARDIQGRLYPIACTDPSAALDRFLSDLAVASPEGFPVSLLCPDGTEHPFWLWPSPVTGTDQSTVLCRPGEPSAPSEIDRVCRLQSVTEALANTETVEPMATIVIETGLSFLGAATIEQLQTREDENREKPEGDEWFRAIQELSPDGLIILDPVHGDDGEIVDYVIVYENPAAGRMNGSDHNHVAGRRLLELFPGVRDTRFFAAYRHASQTGKVVEIEEPYEGESIAEGSWFHIAVVPLGGGIAVQIHDITARKQAQAAVAEAALFPEQNPNPVLRITETGDVLYLNAAAQVLWEVTPDTQETPSIERLVAAGRLALRDGTRREVEIVCAGGRDYSFDCVPFPIRGYANLYGRDITDRNQVIESLQASEERYRALFTGMTEGFALHEILCDEQGVPCDYRFLDVNPAFERLTGLKREDVVGRTMAQALPNEDLAWIQAYGTVALTGESIHFDKYAPTLKRHYDVFAFRPAQGQFAVLFTDITDRRRTEEALIEASRRMRYHVDNSPLAVVEFDTDFLITRWSPEAEQVFGWSAGEMLGKHIWAVPWVHPEDQAGVEELSEAMTAGSSSRNVHANRNLRKDGSVLWCEWYNSSLMDEDGHLVSVLSLVLDVTERVQAQQALADSNRAKDDFLAMLAHELRNPLGAIGNAAALIETQTGGHTNLHMPVGILNRQVRHAARLVDDLLDVSRITRGKMELHKGLVDLSEIVQRAAETAGPQMDAFRHDFKVSVSPSPLWLEGDSTRLEQVVGNLLHNAAKYTDPGGHISLSVTREGDNAVIRVQDDGQGIEEAMLPHVFDLFTQEDRSLARSKGGLGIGLTLVKRLLALHGGTVEAYSAGPGRGSRFLVRLPLVQAGPPEQIEQGTAEAFRPGRRILIVEDNIDAATALGDILSAWGHEVIAVHDGKSGLEAAVRHSPEVVLLDIGLPGMDGFEIARALRRGIVAPNCCLIALTGYGQETDQRRSREAGFDRHLIKPVDIEKLRGLLADDMAGGGGGI